MPIARSNRLALPLRNEMSQPIAAVKAMCGGDTALDTAIGSAMAQFLGTSAPKTICTVVAITSASPTDTAALEMPHDSSGTASKVASDGSAKKPTSKDVTVMPS